MAGLPVLSGAVQLTDRLSVVPSTASTVGGASVAGGHLVHVGHGHGDGLVGRQRGGRPSPRWR